MSEIQYARGSVNVIEHGKNKESNLGYIASRVTDATKLINQLLASSTTYDWSTAAGSNLCVKMELPYCRVTENRYHDYLPVYQLEKAGESLNPVEPIYSDDFMDIVAEILRRWW